jgi:hypothetical protein
MPRGNKMEMVKGKLNVFFVDTELQWEPHKKNSTAVVINATEDEFNSLIESYVSEIESEGQDFNINFFRNYALKSGYYCYVEIYKVQPPYTPVK